MCVCVCIRGVCRAHTDFCPDIRAQETWVKWEMNFDQSSSVACVYAGP